MEGPKSATISAILLSLLWMGCQAGSPALKPSETAPMEVAVVDVADVDKSYFIPGEAFRFEISLRGIVGGRAVLAVGEPGVVDGRSQVIVRSSVESAGIAAIVTEVRDEIESTIDLRDGWVVTHGADSKFGKREGRVDTNLGGGKAGPFFLDYQAIGKRKGRERQLLPKGTYAYDIHSILGSLRAWRAQVGTQESLHLLSGRRLWRSTLRVQAVETIKTRMGKHLAYRVDGKAQRVNRRLKDITSKKPRFYSVWFSDDASRLPLLILAKTEYGDLRVELVEYSRPDRRRLTSR